LILEEPAAMRCRSLLRSALLLLLLMSLPIVAHTVDYQVESKSAVVVTLRFGDKAAILSKYQVFAPSLDEPVQIGRTDAQGRIAFLPTEPGLWRVKVSTDLEHGLHGTNVDIEVDQDMVVKSVSQPLVATHTRLVVGVSLLFGVFGLWSLIRHRAAR
jgi:nickel transport protein